MSKRFGVIFSILIFAGFAWADQGGNDSFGHMWTDSKGTVSVDYDWFNINELSARIIGPAFSEADPVGIELPSAFAFEFFGGPKDSIYVSENGWFSFIKPSDSVPVDGGTAFANGPDSMIAVFWHDLENL